MKKDFEALRNQALDMYTKMIGKIDDLERKINKKMQARVLDGLKRARGGDDSVTQVAKKLKVIFAAIAL